ncbi:MAG: DNA mismatch repair protein MutH, partial [Candidatus Micrarchaeota archaeon]|nr:DNA mismatch repair protein MutH [Candidatus Micrarchaeota archaeon]
ENGMQVIYGDTDSIFIKQPTQEQIDSLIKFVKENIHIDLEQDKSYRYVVLSNRRKNYFGIKIDGSTDIKGLSGKKSNTPKFIRDLFTNILENLKTVNHVEDFERTKQFISNEIKKSVMGFDALSFEDLSYKVLIRQTTDSYKIKPLAVRAAEQLGEHVHVGSFVEFLKVRGSLKVKPIQLVKRQEIDKEKYMETLETVISQVIEPMDLDFDELLGKGKQVKMSDFW